MIQVLITLILQVVIKLQTYDPNNLTLNSSRPEFIIKDKKNLWRKNKLYDLYSKGQTLRESGITRYFKRQENIT